MSEEFKKEEEEKVTFDKNRRYCSLDEDLIELFIEQIAHELYNKNLYLMFSNYYDTEGLYLMAKYYKARAEEEDNHHKWILEYLSYCDVEFSYPEVKSVQLYIKDRNHPLLATIDREIVTTIKINHIVDKAIELKDWQTFNWLMGNGPVDGNLVTEQSEEENLSRAVADICEDDSTPWIIKQEAVIKLYENE